MLTPVILLWPRVDEQLHSFSEARRVELTLACTLPVAVLLLSAVARPWQPILLFLLQLDRSLGDIKSSKHAQTQKLCNMSFLMTNDHLCTAVSLKEFSVSYLGPRIYSMTNLAYTIDRDRV